MMRWEKCMKILLVEDDERTASFVKKGFEQAGFIVEHANNGQTGLSWALQATFDAAIIDLMIPNLNGIELIEKIRNARIPTPIIILSAKNSVEDKVKGLQSGGDDYLEKPFSFTELLARVNALIRRSSKTTEPTTLTVGPLTMDLLTRKVTRESRDIDLQPREFVLLEYLMRNARQVVSKTMIMEHVWEYNFDPCTNVVEARICRLREKIDRTFDKKLIHTIRGVGYVIEER